jgi:putative transposase
LTKYGRKNGLYVLAYCLMDNHVHFLVVPREKDSLARVFNSTHMRYSQYFNRKHNIAGHLWQGRFYSCLLDARHLLAATRYVERNPVRAKIVNAPEAWEWSSAAAHCGTGNGDFDLDLDKLWEYTGTTQSEWKEFLREEDKPDEISDIRGHTHTGRPLGGNVFIKKLELRLGRRLHALPVGRPWPK